MDFELGDLEFPFGSLELKNSIFLHFPRTGGSWVNHCLHDISNKIDPDNETRFGHVPYYSLSESQINKFCFSFIRHPFDWYASIYHYAHNISKEHKGTKPDAFVHYFIQMGFGIYHQSLDFFGLDYEIDFIGKYENLTEDLIVALEMAGEDFDKEYIRSVSCYNPQETKAKKINFSNKTKKLIYKFDRKIFDRFEYRWTK